MKKTVVSLALGMAVLSTASVVQARDTKLILPVKDALNYVGKGSSAREALAGYEDIKLVFGKGGGNIVRKDVVANKKTNAFNKSDVEACHWVFLSALKSLLESAREAGATRIVNIVSYYKRNEFKSTTDYECHAGAIMAGVALKGDIAR